MNTPLPQPSAEERAHSGRLVALIREEITSQGPMPFSRFMERCLYAPGLGYYSAGRTKFGAAGDDVADGFVGARLGGLVHAGRFFFPQPHRHRGARGQIFLAHCALG